MSAALPLNRPPDAPHPPILLPSPLRWRPTSVWPLVIVQAILGIVTIVLALFAAGGAVADFFGSWRSETTVTDIALRFALIPVGIAMLGLARILPQGGNKTLAVARAINSLGCLATLAWAGWLIQSAWHTYPYGYFLEFNYELGFKGLCLALVAVAWCWAACRAHRLLLEARYTTTLLRVMDQPAPYSDGVETPNQ